MVDEYEKEADMVVEYKHIFENIDPELRKTKIMCSMGAQSWDVDVQSKLIENGMNLICIDMSVGDQKEHLRIIENNNAALLQQAGKTCGVLLDLAGSHLMTNATTSGQNIMYQKGDLLELYGDAERGCDEKVISTAYEALTKSVEVGQIILIDEGLFKLEVTEVSEDVNYVQVQAKNDYKLSGQKKIRIPDSSLNIPCLSEKDESDIVNFAVKQDVDFIAPSSIRKVQDVDQIRELLNHQQSAIQIFSKINSQEALENYDDILAASDGVIIVRSELALEFPLEKVYVAQKWMIEKANLAGKPVIVSTQTLDSMIKAPRPTRAEATDIANCILDGVDCIHLTDEVSKGDYPINAVTCLGRIAVETEKTLNHKKIYNDILEYTPTPVPNAEAMAQTVCLSLIENQDVTLIVNMTESGKLPRMISKYRPAVKVLSTAHDNVLRSMAPLRGVQNFQHPDIESENAIKYMIEEAKVMKLCKIGDKIAIVTSKNDDQENEVNDFKLQIVN